jgi:uncharacterized membrane protein YhaH (DUF805 family)
MTHPFVITFLAFSWGGVNIVGVILFAVWGYRDRFAYRGSQPAGEGNPETRELKQVLIAANEKPFAFDGGVGRGYFVRAMLVYSMAGFGLVVLFFQFVPAGMTLGEYLAQSASLLTKLVWLALFLTLHVYHWAAVIRRLRATMKNPWGMVLCAPLFPLYLIQLIALAQGKDGTLVQANNSERT